MLEILTYQFMQWALLAAIVTGVLCSCIGVFVTLRGLTFMGGGIVHAAFAGAAFAIMLSVNYGIRTDPLLFALIFALVSALIIGHLSERGGMRLDVAIGVMFALTMAFAILFIGMMDQYTSDIYGILFGDILSVGRDRTITMIILGTIILMLLLLFFKEFEFIIFDQEMAEASGIPARPLFYLLLTLIAITIAVSLRSVGALLVLALIVTPAAAGGQLTHDIRKMIALSIIFGVTSSIGGLFASWYLDLPSGSMIVIIVSLIFFVSFIISPKQRRLRTLGGT